VRSCQAAMTPTLCGNERIYQHYVSMTEAALSLPVVALGAGSSPSPELPAITLPVQSRVFGAPVTLESYQWSTTEQPLPLPLPLAQP
jgi:hypothetical protein